MRRVGDWLRQAERDLEEARYAEAGGYYELTCFLSQQCAEKAVKALLQFRGIERSGHMIIHLLDYAPHSLISNIFRQGIRTYTIRGSLRILH